MDESDLKDRYQFQPFHIKLWRRRHQIRVPLDWLRMVFYTCILNQEISPEDKVAIHPSQLLRLPRVWRWRASVCWGVVNGYADMKMKRYYTLDEVMEEFGDD